MRRAGCLVTLLVGLFAASSCCHGSSPVRLALTGDVNLNPFLYRTHPGEYDYIWGDTLSTITAMDAFLINHEATIANVVDDDPNNFQMEVRNANGLSPSLPLEHSLSNPPAPASVPLSPTHSTLTQHQSFPTQGSSQLHEDLSGGRR